MMAKTEEGVREIKKEFSRAGMWLLGLAWMIVAGIGVTTAFSSTGPARIVGWFFLSIATVTFVGTMDRWIKVFPGLLVYGVFGGFVATATGHSLNRPEIPLSLWEGLLLMLFFGASAGISYTLTNRSLRPSDRIALFAFVALFFREMMLDRISPLGLGAALGCLVLAWTYDRIRRRSHSRKTTA